MRDENVDKDMDCLQFSNCPACKNKHDTALILPCSHIMCVHCVSAGEAASSAQPLRRGASPPVCSVLCPCCRHAVELPCWAWSSATSCLPKHPTLRSACVGQEAGTMVGRCEDPIKHVQRRRDTHCRDEETAQSCSLGSSDCSVTTAPLDGAINLREADMERSVFGLCFALDPSTVPSSLRLSSSFLTVTYQGGIPPDQSPQDPDRRSMMTSDPGTKQVLPRVCADVVLARGQYYWEVDVCNSSIYRIGVSSLDGSEGWWLEKTDLSFCAIYDRSMEPLCTVPPQIKTLGVFLNFGGGVLSFHNPLTQEHLVTLPTRFNPAGVLPSLCLGQGRLRMRCGLPPPPHVFLSKDSTYREPCGSRGGRWQREIPFRSVRRVIRIFEDLAVSDSDSGPVSSFGSSCSTLA